jgi:hypothetical protein
VNSAIHGRQMGSGPGVPAAATVEVVRGSFMAIQMADIAKVAILTTLGTEAATENGETAQA